MPAIQSNRKFAASENQFVKFEPIRVFQNTSLSLTIAKLLAVY